jgi:large subunit ribosomal protein L10
MNKETKTQVVGEIKETFSDVTAVILADFRGIDVPTVTAIRHEFQKAGCGYKVLKNTMVKLAIKDSDMEPMSALMSGPTAVIWTTDALSAPAKLAIQFAKDEEKFSVKGGFFEGEVLDAVGVE